MNRSIVISILAAAFILIPATASPVPTVGTDQRRPASCTVTGHGRRTMVSPSVNGSSCEWSLVVTAPSHVIVADVVVVARNEPIGTGRSSMITDGPILMVAVDDDNGTIVTSDIDRLIARRSMRLVWTDESSSGLGQSSFVLEYTVFESDECQGHESTGDLMMDNVVVVDDDGAAVSKVGSKVRYACASATDDRVEAECVYELDDDDDDDDDDDRGPDREDVQRSSSLSMPSWSRRPPTNCTGCGSAEPVRIRLTANGTQLLSYDGNSGATSSSIAECRWEVEAIDEDAIVRVDLEWLRVPPPSSVDDGPSRPWLEIYDGDRTEARLLLRRFHGGLDDDYAGATSFVSLHGKIVLAIATTNVTSSHDAIRARFVADSSPRCRPSLIGRPTHGDFRGSESLVAIFTCDDGHRLTGGSERSECTASGSWNSSDVPPVCRPEVEVAAVDKTPVVGTPPRFKKISRPRPQSTEEKGYEKASVSKDELPVKSPDIDEGQDVEEPQLGSGEPEMDRRSGSSGRPVDGSNYGDDSDDALMTDYTELDEYEERHTFDDDDDEGHHQEQEGMAGDGGSDVISRLPVMAIVLSVTLPLLACTVVAVSCIVYRRLYPVRMGPGRRFETFENPIYGRRSSSSMTTTAKRSSSATGGSGTTTAAKAVSPVHRLAHSPAELERLTTTVDGSNI